MAWTTPRTWADGDIPTAALLNTHVRDNLNALSTHTHSGAAGDGNDEMTGVDTITIDDSGSTPAAPGSSKVKIFSESETLKIRAGASGAATALSLSDHTHTAAVTANEMDQAWATGSGAANVAGSWTNADRTSIYNNSGGGVAVTGVTVTDTFTSGNPTVAVASGWSHQKGITFVDPNDPEVNLHIDGTIVDSVVRSSIGVGSTYRDMLIGTKEVSSGSRTYLLQYWDDNMSTGGGGTASDYSYTIDFQCGVIAEELVMAYA